MHTRVVLQNSLVSQLRRVAVAFGAIMCALSACRMDAQTGGNQSAVKRAIDFRVAKPFTRVRAVRELSDGSVLISEKEGEGIFLLSATGAVVRKIGREGDGPEEYRKPAFFYATGRDSTLVTGHTGTPWLLLYRSEFLTPPRKWTKLSETTQPDISGVDRTGTIFSVQRFKKMSNGKIFPYNSPAADTVLGLLLRLDGKVDTIRTFRAKSLGVRKVMSTMGTMAMSFVLGSPFQSQDQGVMFPDGVIAVAHYAPYSIDWILNGVRSAPKTAFISTPLRETTAEMRQAAAQRAYHNKDGSILFKPDQFPEWPKVVPAFVENALIPADDGNLYVRRTVISDSDSVAVDVISRGGGLREIIMLPPRARLLSVSIRGLYVVLLNDDDEEFLVRYAVAK
jgi:hypothetical protein